MTGRAVDQLGWERVGAQWYLDRVEAAVGHLLDGRVVGADEHLILSHELGRRGHGRRAVNAAHAVLSFLHNHNHTHTVQRETTTSRFPFRPPPSPPLFPAVINPV